MTTQGAATVESYAPPHGLTRREVAERVEQGLANRTHETSSRSVGDILKANLLTRFNALLGSMLVVILIVGPLQDALFGLILVANALIGILQEFRAKLTLDRLAFVAAPRATVWREGVEQSIAVADIVQDDSVGVGPGDEIAVDGRLESAEPIEVNESLLTGEAAAVAKVLGDQVLSGSFVVAGRGIYRATHVGEATYARRLAAEARRFQLVSSQLMAGINQILRVVTWIIAPTALLLIASQLRANPSLQDAARASVAGVITLIPEGLVLLTSATLALAVIRLGRRKVLIQQLAAVEMLARTDIVCFDKTGTLTEREIALDRVEPLEAGEEWKAALGAFAHADPEPNPSLRAIARAFPPAEGWTAVAGVPFSSDRKWSAVRFTGHGWWVLGAADVIDPARAPVPGRRELLLARAAEVRGASFAGVQAAGLVLLAETVKPGAAKIVRELVAQGVTIKLISGDHPESVAAIGAAAGLPAGEAVDGRTLPRTSTELVELARRATVFGRVTPEQKRAIVRALRSPGHVVAMAGDGVNDVLALKEADLGIAIGGGSSAARAVSACILTDGTFDSVPDMLVEGRRVIGNVERLASLFFTKTVYAFLLAVAVGVAMVPFPFLPRQLTLISAFTIGIPSVFFALGPSFEPSRTAFLRRVLGFALPAGAVAAAATFAAYAMAVYEPNVSLAEERTAATLVMAAIGLWVLARLARPLTRQRRALIAAMIAGLTVTVLATPLRAFFDLDLPRLIVAFAATGIVAVALVVLEAGDRAATALGRRLQSAGYGASGPRPKARRP